MEPYSVPELEPAASARIGFRVRIEQGPRIVNQGIVASTQLPDEPTEIPTTEGLQL